MSLYPTYVPPPSAVVTTLRVVIEQNQPGSGSIVCLSQFCFIQVVPLVVRRNRGMMANEYITVLNGTNQQHNSNPQQVKTSIPTKIKPYSQINHLTNNKT